MSSQKSIEELALKHINRHPNDKSSSVLAKMRRQYGREATLNAIYNACEIMNMVIPNHPNTTLRGKLFGEPGKGASWDLI